MLRHFRLSVGWAPPTPYSYHRQIFTIFLNWGLIFFLPKNLPDICPRFQSSIPGHRFGKLAMEGLPDEAVMNERMRRLQAGPSNAPREFDEAVLIEGWDDPLNAASKLVFQEVMEELDNGTLAFASTDRFAKADEAAARAQQDAEEAALLATGSDAFCAMLKVVEQDSRFNDRYKDATSALCQIFPLLQALHDKLGAVAQPQVVKRGHKKPIVPTVDCEKCGKAISSTRGCMSTHLKYSCKGQPPSTVVIDPFVYYSALCFGLPGSSQSAELLAFLSEFVPQNIELTATKIRTFKHEVLETGLVRPPHKYNAMLKTVYGEELSDDERRRKLQDYVLADLRVLTKDTHDESELWERVRPLECCCVTKVSLRVAILRVTSAGAAAVGRRADHERRCT